MTRLLVISSAPVTFVDEMPFLDKKFYEGMCQYAELWSGPVSCLLRPRKATFPFGQVFEQSQIPFGMTFLRDGQEIAAQDLAGLRCP